MAVRSMFQRAVTKHLLEEVWVNACQEANIMCNTLDNGRVSMSTCIT